MRRSDCRAPFGLAEPISPLGLAPRFCTLAVVLAIWLVGGCSGPILSFRSDATETAAEPASTGSIAKPPKSFGKDLSDEDWRRADAALTVALDPQGNGKPVKWDNPETGMRGTVNPTGLPYVAQDEICRDFITSVSKSSGTRTMRGTGCKASGGSFELKRLRSVKS